MISLSGYSPRVDHQIQMISFPLLDVLTCSLNLGRLLRAHNQFRGSAAFLKVLDELDHHLKFDNEEQDVVLALHAVSTSKSCALK